MANALLIEHLLQVNWEINCVLKLKHGCAIKSRVKQV